MFSWMAKQMGYGQEKSESDDVLSKFQSDLKNQTEELHKKLLVWQNIKREIIKSAPDLPFETYEEQHATTKEELIAIFASMWRNIKSFLLPADQVLQDIVKLNKPHLQELYNHLLEWCDLLQSEFAEELSADEKARIKLEISNISIVMLTELLAMYDKVSEQINYCLRTEGIGETLANQLVGRVVDLLLKVPLPDITFNLHDEYRVFLTNEISDGITKVNDVTIHSKGMLDNAEKTVSDKRSTLFHPGNSGMPKPEVAAGSSLRMSPHSSN